MLLRLLRWLFLAFIVTVIPALLNGCSFSPSGPPAGDDDVVIIDADNGDGGIDGGMPIDGAIDASTDALTDASVDAMTTDPDTVVIELVTPDNVRSGHPEETLVRLRTGANVLTCDRSATTPSGVPLSGWNGNTIVTSNPFEVAMEKGRQTLMASCTTIGGLHPQAAPLEVRAMRLELVGSAIEWDGPEAYGPARCSGIAIPFVNGGIGNGQAYENPGTRPFSPAGSSQQGMACANAVGGTITYRATISVVVGMKSQPPPWWQKLIAEARQSKVLD